MSADVPVQSRLAVLARMSAVFADTSLTIETLVRRVVDQLAVALGARVVIQFDSPESALPAETAHPSEAVGKAERDVESGVRSKAIATDRNVLERGALCVLIRSNGRTVGTFSVVNRPAMGSFSSEDLLLVEELASRVEIALETSRLLAKARAAEERLQLALDAGKLGAWEFNIATGKVAWSATLEQIHGIPVGSFGGTFEDYQSDIHPEDRPRVLETISKSSSGQGEHHLVYRIIRPDGAVRWLDASGQLFYDTAGSPIRMLGVCCDVTERVEAEEQRQQLFERTEAAVRAREDLLAMVSHDLRNPLSVIVMTSALQSKTLADPKAKLQADRIRSAAKRMEELITNLLDASSIEIGNFNVTFADVPLATLINDSLEAVSPLASQKGVLLEVRVDNFDVSISCDKARIGQVLGNLLSNAIKFSPSGEVVTIETRVVERMVEFSVKDNGPGVPADHLSLVFERYWKGKQSGRAGTGLGLFIAKGIVKAHRGRIWVESAQGKGSAFCCTLPLSNRTS